MQRTTETSGPGMSPVATEQSSALKPGVGVRVFQNTVAMLAGRAVGILCSAGASVLLARYLGPEKLGEYGALYAYLFLYSFIATFCIEQILAREVSIRRHQAAELFRTATLTTLGFAVAGAVIAPAIAPLFGYTGLLRWLIVVAALDLLVLPPLRLSGIIFQVEMRLWYVTAIGFVRQILWFLAVVLLAFANAAFYQVIIARTLCGVAEYIALLWTLHKTSLIQGTPRFLAKEARHMLKDSFPIVLSTVAVSVYQRIDQVMLHKMVGDLLLAPYVVAVQMTELFNALPVALISSLFPVLAQSADDAPRFDHYLRTTFRLLLVVAFAACALLIPVAHPLVRLLYGTKFSAAAPLLVVLIWSNVPIFFTVVMNAALVVRRLQNYLPFFAVGGAATNIALNLELIPRYGALGAAWATVVSYGIAGVLLFLVFGRTRRLVLVGMRVGAGPFLLVLFLTVALHWAPWPAPVKFGAAALVYFAGALATRALQLSDIQRLWMMVRNAVP